MRQNRLDSKRTELLSTRFDVHVRAFVCMYAYVGVLLVGFAQTPLLRCIHHHHHNHDHHY
jgi:hypothetical protein